MVVLQNVPNPAIALDGLTLKSEFIERNIANFDLSLSMEEKDGQFLGGLQYKTDLFSAATISHLLEQFQSLLQTLVANPDLHLSELPILNVPPPKQLVNSGNPGSSTPEPSDTFVPPRDDLEFKIAKIWEQVLDLRPISVTDNLFALGGDSLLAIRLSEQIEKAFHKNIPLGTIFHSPTVEKLAHIVRQQGSVEHWSFLTPIQPNGSKPPLFLCEGVGIYYPLIPHLEPDQPLYGLVAGTSQSNVFQYDRLEDLAVAYLDEMRRVQPQGPYYLGGISWGGVIAFEIAQQLVKQGEKVDLLAFFDTIRPGAYKPHPLRTRLFWHLKRLSKQGLKYGLERIHEKLKNIGFKQLENTNDTILAKGQIMPVPQNNEHAAMRDLFGRACENYQPTAYPGRITIFMANDREDSGAYYVEPGLGWASLASDVEIHEVPGDHLSILKEPHVEILGKRLTMCIEKVRIENTYLLSF
jgi:thioesterase domain-containing protein/acyl carrier protein